MDIQLREVATTIATAVAAREEAGRLAAELVKAHEALGDTQSKFALESATRAHAVAQRDAAVAAQEESKSFLLNAQEKLRIAFVEAASKVFDEKAMALDRKILDSSELSKRGLEETLKPFAERVGQFQVKLELLASDDARERATLVGTIGELKTLNQGMADAANALTKALKGNAKARGDWGELILETVLKASGLEEGKNFERQAHTTDEESGQRRQPDVVVLLPDGRKVVVDSKVNLIAWADANGAESPEAYQDALIRHAAALRLHMRDLSEKNYPKLIGAQALDMTVLFVPIEGALSAALSLNPDLQTEAFGKRVVFASPNTLMAMLSVVERLWTRDKLQKQIGIIGAEAGRLLDTIISFMDEFEVVETRIKQSADALKQAKNRLSDSPQSVLARTRRLIEAGVKGKKAIPEELQPVAGDEGLLLPAAGDSD